MTNVDLLPILEAAGLDVTAADDYQTNQRPYKFSPIGTMVHHTASRNTSLHTIARGYTGLPGPLSQLFVETIPEPRLHLVSNGYCNHAGRGMGAALGRTRNDIAPPGDAEDPGDVIGNRWYIAAEIEGPPIKGWSYLVTVRAFAAIHVAFEWPAERCISHREWTSRKVDPQFSDKTMDDFRRDLAAVIEEMTMGDTAHETKHQFHAELQMKSRSWADRIWPEYVAAGGSTVPESRTWRTTREDLAWVWKKFMKPQAEKLVEHEDRIAALEKDTGEGLASRVAIVEQQIKAIHAATATD